jgi:hypothetical protein
MGLMHEAITAVLRAFVRHGLGVSQDYTTVGDGATRKLLENNNEILPEIVLMADPSNTHPIYIGFTKASFPLSATTGPIYLKWVNPAEAELVYSDGGQAGQVLHVIG